jgi:KaiC/GvpD/RAD55 family RecA-like ATPase
MFDYTPEGVDEWLAWLEDHQNDEGSDSGNEPEVVSEPGGVLTPAGIVSAWITTPARPQFATGLAPLDALCGGGLTFPRRVIAVGAPGAGKTAVMVAIADQLERAGICVGFLAVDEEPEAITMRLAQMAGFDRQKLEARDMAELQEAKRELAAGHFRFYEYDHTIEHAAADLAAWASSLGKRAALFVDSIQTVRCRTTRELNTPREIVEANVRAIKSATDTHGLLVYATCEANRAAYQNPAEARNPIAAGAESRSIEFCAQTLLVLMPDDEDQRVFHVHIAKNRGLAKGSFALRLEPGSHTLAAVDADELKEDREIRKAAELTARAGSRAAGDARVVAAIIVERPGITRNALLEAIRERRGSFDDKRLGPATRALGDALVTQDGPNKSKAMHIDLSKLPESIRVALDAASSDRGAGS